MSQEVYTAPQLAEALQVSTRQAYNMLQRKELPGIIRIGRLVRVRRESVDQWLKDQSASDHEQR